MVWPRSDWGVALQLGPQDVVTGGELNAQRLDFALMAQIAQRLLDALAQPLEGVLPAGHAPLSLSAALGIAVYPSSQGDAQLLAQADSAAQSVKRGGGNGFVSHRSECPIVWAARHRMNGALNVPAS